MYQYWNIISQGGAEVRHLCHESSGEVYHKTRDTDITPDKVGVKIVFEWVNNLSRSYRGHHDANFNVAILDGHKEIVAHEKFQQLLHKKWGQRDKIHYGDDIRLVKALPVFF